AINFDNIYSSGSEAFTINYCDIDTLEVYGGWTGEGNINQDPLFDLSGSHPYALLPGSPCIDTGTPDTTGLCLPSCDLMGCCRIWDGDGNGVAVIDMGAYEFDSPMVGIAKPVITQHRKETNLTGFPNPFTTSTTIEFELKAETPVTLQVYNHMGQQVADLLNESRAPGNHQFTWKAAHLPPGLYFLRLQAGNEVRTGKVIKY
ncbi:MAG: T9SS type A sorting domain-containing protein, partial [Bacteroidales bacterium]|nr:T9SS type A sorting domain-containing protein [Bacteroidales bacterium]